MAEKEAEKKEDGEEGAAEAAPAGKSKKKLFIIIGGVVVLLLAIGIPVFFMSSKTPKEEHTEELDPEAAQKANALVAEGHEDEEELLEGEEPLGAMYPLDTFVVNLSGGKYIRLQAQLEFSGRDVPSRFYARQVLVRDGLITLLSAKAQDELQTPKDKEQLKNEIKDLVNEVLKKEEVKKVFFTQFLVQ